MGYQATLSHGTRPSRTGQTKNRGKTEVNERYKVGSRTGNVRQVQSSSKRLRPRRRERKLQARDPAPRAEKVTLLHELIPGGSRGVVAADEREGPVLDALPEPLAVLRLPDRRRALVKRAAVRDFLGGEREVVGASLRGDPLALATRLGDHLEAVGVGDVRDVDGRTAGSAGNLHELSDGILRRERGG